MAREAMNERAVKWLPLVGLSPVLGEPAANGDDCVSCGRCCHHGPRTVHLLQDDEARMGDALMTEWTVEEPPYFRFIKNAGDACGALDRSVPDLYPCAIYTHRPEDCRIVEAGSPACIEARRLGRLGNSELFLRSDRTDL